MKELNRISNRQEFMNFIIYKIFDNDKYNQHFVLEGSNVLFLKGLNSNNISFYFRMPKDLDFNFKNIENNFKVLKEILIDIFKDEKDLKLFLYDDKYDVDDVFNVYQFKMQKEEFSVKINFDLVYETENYETEALNFEFGDQQTKINIYLLEKYLSNKIIAIKKEKIKSDQTENFLDNYGNVKELQNLTDLIWMLKKFEVDIKKLIQILSNMFYLKRFEKSVTLEQYLSYLIVYVNDANNSTIFDQINAELNINISKELLISLLNKLLKEV
ncbi:nucleotidyl transferase AbiEii/AbiGii toxin family protein [Mycoplasma procyoni]|uniref:nucleotidyl transferase AbiEii/AbiGii toxin family protein n=1 Tax=Mycoplasma procyoni TaxID=568784 RepID=UPI00197C7146|nr:nucleotidyl transferase AbiEii/AbiGii toxin family protein [Mycoplasma procyoni]MBN3534646.1 nucleotidyl transferase AbiEii/AbiGii toxin family protein [Mycoplasma procyoni]